MIKKKLLLVLMTGLVGSGKSTVAKELARALHARLVRSDAIRAALRRNGKQYDTVRTLALREVENALGSGKSVVLDADVVDSDAVQNARALAKKHGADVSIVRTICDIDVAIARAITGRYGTPASDLFVAADSLVKKPSRLKGASVKVREMMRRLPHHYRWDASEGGRWVLKKRAVTATIDTTDAAASKNALRRFLQRAYSVKL